MYKCICGVNFGLATTFIAWLIWIINAKKVSNVAAIISKHMFIHYCLCYKNMIFKP